MFSFAQISDSHMSGTLDSATNLAKDLNNTFCVHTGDISNNVFEDGIGAFDNTVFVPIVGNHDALLKSGTTTSSYDWSKQPTQTQLYTRFFKTCPLVSTHENTTWWFRVFETEKVMVIGLNNAIYNATVINEQRIRLQEWLNYALENDLGVIVFMHGTSITKFNVVDCVFTNPTKADSLAKTTSNWNSMYPNLTPLQNTLLNFKGKLLGIFTGHTHTDLFAYTTKIDGTKVPYVIIGSQIISTSNNVSRSNKVANSFSSVLMNLYRYDKDLNSLQIYRLGADGCSDGARRKMLSWRYDKQDIVSSCSLRS